MTLNYFDNSKVAHLVEEYYELKLSNNAIPFETTILPIGNTHITCVFKGKQKAIIKKTETLLEDIIVSGQFFRSYQFITHNASRSFGISLHPTALFKILNTDISILRDKHLPLSEFNNRFYNIIKPILNKNKKPKEIVDELNNLFLNMNLTIDNHTLKIDKVINIIKEKEGLLTVQEVLDDICISQKTLETQFKKIVGLTPGKYIRLYRFLKLMRKYESQQIDIKDLIYMYNYYDRSHFTKDFKLFMKKSPKNYFNVDNPFLNEYLKKR